MTSATSGGQQSGCRQCESKAGGTQIQRVRWREFAKINFVKDIRRKAILQLARQFVSLQIRTLRPARQLLKLVMICRKLIYQCDQARLCDDNLSRVDHGTIVDKSGIMKESNTLLFRDFLFFWNPECCVDRQFAGDINVCFGNQQYLPVSGRIQRQRGADRRRTQGTRMGRLPCSTSSRSDDVDTAPQHHPTAAAHDIAAATGGQFDVFLPALPCAPRRRRQQQQARVPSTVELRSQPA